MKKITAVLTAAMLILSAASCGGSQPAATAAQETTATVQTEAETTAEETEAAAPDFSNPDVTIELGDYDAMQTLSKSIQNFEMTGKIVKITGISSRNISSCSIGQKDGEGNGVGTVYKVEGFTYPDDYAADGEVVTVVAEVVAEGIVCSLKILPENYSVQ